MPHRFPQEAVLRDGRRVMLRPFAKRDVAALYEFFQRLPEENRRFAWHRIDDRAVVERWGVELDYEKVMPLLALDGKRIVADATLHRRALMVRWELALLAELGFRSYEVPGYGTDPDGNQHDMTLMVFKL